MIDEDELDFEDVEINDDNMYKRKISMRKVLTS